MRLTALLTAAGVADATIAWPAAAGGPGPEVTDVEMVSDQVRAGALFACVKGAHADGHLHAAGAVARGAVALLCERRVDLEVPQVVVASVRQAVGPVAAALWSWPSRSMTVVGVTGTNGKTTTCALMAGIFEAEGWAAEMIGTLTGARTTPEATALQRRLAEMRDQGTRAVAMEVSSHALDQHRVAGTEFAAGVFTNLSQDHLDYHETMEAYFEAKAQLFVPGRVRVAVVNRSGQWGARMAGLAAANGVDVVTFSPEEATEVVLGPHGAAFSWRGERLGLQMGGRFNVVNAVAAAATARQLGVGWDAVRSGLASVRPVRGRFEALDRGQPFSVLVDFAHTPAALSEALRAARELTGDNLPDPEPATGRVIVVFGAGGDRDRGKRPLMGKVAAELADLVFLTSDNPRGEDPMAIIEEVARGLGHGRSVIEADRGDAIARALSAAAPGDVVLIAGKGHETGQDFGSYVEPFDDLAVAGDALAGLGYARGTEPR